MLRAAVGPCPGCCGGRFRMQVPWPIFCDQAELAVEMGALARARGLQVEPELSSDPLGAAATAQTDAPVALVAMLEPPAAADLVRTVQARGAHAPAMALGLVQDPQGRVRGLAADLGLPCVLELGALLSCGQLLASGVAQPWRANPRGLDTVARTRMESGLAPSKRGAGRWVSEAEGRVAWRDAERGAPLGLGPATDASAATAALRDAAPLAGSTQLPGQDAEPERTREVLFGPPRTLSDPASKAALAPYGLPFPQEELCSSPSRAAAEAARIGFPVRISLASPDLRVWDHPDLTLDGVDNAARVRDVYRQLTAVASERAPQARVLGVTVAATQLARALLRVDAEPLPHGRVLVRVGFADPHGAVALDHTWTVLPAAPAAVQRALQRLHGHPLLFGQHSQERKRARDALSDLLGRVCRFVDDWRQEARSVTLHPVALLVDSSTEVREAAVEVSDAFVRGL